MTNRRGGAPEDPQGPDRTKVPGPGNSMIVGLVPSAQSLEERVWGDEGNGTKGGGKSKGSYNGDISKCRVNLTSKIS